MVSAILLALQLAAAAPATPPPADAAAQAPPLTLSEAVAEARRASPLRASALALAEGLTDAAALAGRPPNPLVDVRTENWVPGRTPGLTTPLLDVYATVVQPIELAGKRGARRDVTVADRDAAAAALRVVDRRIALETVHAYVQALRARTQLLALTANRSGLGAIVDTMRLRLTEGVAPESDVLKFVTEASRLDVEIARTRVDLARSLAALATVVGRTAPIDAAALVEPPPIDAPTLTPASLDAAVGRLPDVAAARARLDRARAALALEHARRVPDPAVTAGYKRTAGQNTTLVGVAMSVPLFDRNGEAVARASAEERAAARDLDALTHRLTAEAASLADAASTLARRAAQADTDLIQPADGVRSAARAAFREGSTDVLRLIDAERVYSDVRRTALDLRLDAFVAAVDARFARGEENVP